MSSDVENVFAVLMAHYGTARMQAHWEGQKPAVIKAYWAHELRGCTAAMVGYALENLPEFPPSVTEFRAIARRCPPPPVVMIDSKPTAEEIERSRSRIAALAERFGNKRRTA